MGHFYLFENNQYRLTPNPGSGHEYRSGHLSRAGLRVDERKLSEHLLGSHGSAQLSADVDKFIAWILAHSCDLPATPYSMIRATMSTDVAEGAVRCYGKPAEMCCCFWVNIQDINKLQPPSSAFASANYACPALLFRGMAPGSPCFGNLDRAIPKPRCEPIGQLRPCNAKTFKLWRHVGIIFANNILATSDQKQLWQLTSDKCPVYNIRQMATVAAND